MGTQSAKRCWEGVGRGWCSSVYFSRRCATPAGFPRGIASELCGFTLNAGDRDCIPSGWGHAVPKSRRRRGAGGIARSPGQMAMGTLPPDKPGFRPLASCEKCRPSCLYWDPFLERVAGEAVPPGPGVPIARGRARETNHWPPRVTVGRPQPAAKAARDCGCSRRRARAIQQDLKARINVRGRNQSELQRMLSTCVGSLD